MFTKHIKAWFSKPTPPTAIRLGNETLDLNSEEVLEHYLQRLPGFPDGVPAIKIEAIIKKNQGLIDEIILAKGLTGPHNTELVASRVLAPIQHLAEMTHLLPASMSEHFRLPGGLFSFCLEIALSSIHYAEQRILTRATPEIRREYETLWAHAAFLNGLYNEAIAILSRLKVYSKETQSEWHPGVESLYGWIVRQKITRYQILWEKAEDRSKVHVLAGKAIDKDQADILSKAEWAIYNTLFGALHERNNLANPLAKIYKQVRYKIIESDLWSQPEWYGKAMAGMHLEPWLVDAMRYLLHRKRWVVNEDHGRVWYGLDGVYIVWPLGANDMQRQLKAADMPFVPYTDAVLAEILLSCELLTRSDGLNGYLFDIAVPVAECPEKKCFEAVRLLRPETLFGRGHPYQPLPFNLLREPLATRDWIEEALPEKSIDEDGVITCTQPIQTFVPVSVALDETRLEGSVVYGEDYARAYNNLANANSSNTNHENSTVPPAPEIDPDAETLLATLLGSNKPEQTIKAQPKAKKPAKDSIAPLASPEQRAVALLARLKKLPETALVLQADGTTQVMAKSLKAINLDLADCIAVLKTADYLRLIEGLETGLADQAKSDSRYFWVKMDLVTPHA